MTVGFCANTAASCTSAAEATISSSGLAKLEGLNGINMSQPHLNDMDKVFAATIDKGLHLSLSTPSFDIGKHDGSNLLFLDSM